MGIVLLLAMVNSHRMSYIGGRHAKSAMKTAAKVAFAVKAKIIGNLTNAQSVIGGIVQLIKCLEQTLFQNELMYALPSVEQAVKISTGYFKM